MLRKKENFCFDQLARAQLAGVKTPWVFLVPFDPCSILKPFLHIIESDSCQNFQENIFNFNLLLRKNYLLDLYAIYSMDRYIPLESKYEIS